MAASAINALVISLFNTYWRKIALFLTTWENFRLEADFRASLIWRMFVFQFLNCYFSVLTTPPHPSPFSPHTPLLPTPPHPLGASTPPTCGC